MMTLSVLFLMLRKCLRTILNLLKVMNECEDNSHFRADDCANMPGRTTLTTTPPSKDLNFNLDVSTGVIT